MSLQTKDKVIEALTELKKALGRTVESLIERRDLLMSVEDRVKEFELLREKLNGIGCNNKES
jgi:hypothetical protein